MKNVNQCTITTDRFCVEKRRLLLDIKLWQVSTSQYQIMNARKLFLMSTPFWAIKVEHKLWLNKMLRLHFKLGEPENLNPKLWAQMGGNQSEINLRMMSREGSSITRMERASRSTGEAKQWASYNFAMGMRKEKVQVNILSLNKEKNMLGFLISTSSWTDLNSWTGKMKETKIVIL